MILQSNPTLLSEGERGGKGVTGIYCDGTEGHVDGWIIKKYLKDIHSSPKTEPLTNMLSVNLHCYDLWLNSE